MTFPLLAIWRWASGHRKLVLWSTISSSSRAGAEQGYVLGSGCFVRRKGMEGSPKKDKLDL
jgi:hypothetical protein